MPRSYDKASESFFFGTRRIRIDIYEGGWMKELKKGINHL